MAFSNVLRWGRLVGVIAALFLALGVISLTQDHSSEGGHQMESAEMVQVPPAEAGHKLMMELNCAGCHTIAAEERMEIAPDLSSEGSHVQWAWLVDFLRKPFTIRPTGYINGAASRMPDFKLKEDEVMAIAAYLMSRTDPNLKEPEGPAGSASSGKELMGPDALGCMMCHKIGGEGGTTLESLGPDLTNAGDRLTREWVYNWIKDPQQFIPDTIMPTYNLSEMGLPEEGYKDITDYIMSLRSGKAGPEIPEFSSEAIKLGEQLIAEMGCVGCHKIDGFTPAPIAPDLTSQGSKVTRDWLVSFLKKPTTIRPDGYIPGTASRMPDFRLTDEEVEMLSEHIMADLVDDKMPRGLTLTAEETTPEAAERGKNVFTRSNCLGCHTLDGEQRDPSVGGFGGPDLTRVASRLKPDYLVRWVQNPGSVTPNPLMVHFRLHDKEIKELAAYLLTLK